MGEFLHFVFAVLACVTPSIYVAVTLLPIAALDDPGELSNSPGLSPSERESLVLEGAVNTEFFARTFFPKTFRQTSPSFAADLWWALESASVRFVNALCFRGSSKTTRLRVFAAKRIAYRISRTILFVAASEPKAAQSIQWLRLQIERNMLFREVFGLRAGKKWHETEIEVVSTVDGTSSWILGSGITSNLRGINFDDYRPDLIILDDVLTDENVLTSDSRTRMSDLVMGAVANSLAPTSEEPNAKLVMAQTPLHRRDLAAAAEANPAWHTVKFGCWTPDSAGEMDIAKRSSWPERFPAAELLEMKRTHSLMGTLPVWYREMEVKIVSEETSTFRGSLLQYYGEGTEHPEPPVYGTTIVSVDPVPPPTDTQVERDVQLRDFEAIVVTTRKGPNYYLREYRQSRGHSPAWTLTTIFELALTYRATYIAIETTSYQAVLKHLLEAEMQRRGIYFAVLSYRPKPNERKYNRIINGLLGVIVNRRYYVRREHTEFVSMVVEYPKVEHDDLLDAAATGMLMLQQPGLETEGPSEDRERFPTDELPRMRFCP